jgi:hypothetical protein
MHAPTLYVSRRVRIPAPASAIVFDALLAAADDGEGHPTIGTPTAVLGLGAARPVGAVGPTAPLRARPGHLRSASGWRWPFPVDLELTPWSSRAAEVAVRPRARRAPVGDGPRQRRYLGLATAVVDHLAEALEASFAAWEHDVVREAAALVRPAVGT